MKKNSTKLWSSILIVLLLSACGNAGTLPSGSSTHPSSEATIHSSSEPNVIQQLSLPIEGLQWGMSKEDCLSHLGNDVKETLRDDGTIHLTATQEVLGSSSQITLTFRSKSVDDYFTNLPEQYFTQIEIQYALTEYDAIMQQMIQKYGAAWRQQETEEGQSFYFGSYKVENIQEESIKKQVVGYLKTTSDSTTYGETYRTSPEKIWDEMSEDQRSGYETAVLNYISLEAPPTSDFFYLKTNGDLMLPIANAKMITQ